MKFLPLITTSIAILISSVHLNNGHLIKKALLAALLLRHHHHEHHSHPIPIPFPAPPPPPPVQETIVHENHHHHHHERLVTLPILAPIHHVVSPILHHGHHGHLVHHGHHLGGLIVQDAQQHEEWVPHPGHDVHHEDGGDHHEVEVYGDC